MMASRVDQLADCTTYAGIYFDYETRFVYPWFVETEDAPMLVPSKVQKNVIFIGVMEDGQFVPKATGFIVSKITDQHRFLHLVTAEHVISGLQLKKYERPYVRLNMESGEGKPFPTEYEDWHYHPDPAARTDVAVARCAIDRLSIVYSHTPTDALVTDDIIKQDRIGVGDEVFAVGLFRSHYGQKRNIPIVRIGNIALMPEEPVKTRYAGYIDAYLIEARSISGLSGSPVWVHLPPLRVVDGEVRMHEGKQFYLLGLMHGHFDIENMTEDVVQDEGESGSINTGIGVVVPADKILDIIDQPEWEEHRKQIVKDLREKGAATPDLAIHPVLETPQNAPESLDDDRKHEPSTKGGNPQHKEDFNRLLTSVVRGKKPDAQT